MSTNQHCVDKKWNSDDIKSVGRKSNLLTWFFGNTKIFKAYYGCTRSHLGSTFALPALHICFW